MGGLGVEAVGRLDRMFGRELVGTSRKSSKRPETGDALTSQAYIASLLRLSINYTDNI